MVNRQVKSIAKFSLLFLFFGALLGCRAASTVASSQPTVVYDAVETAVIEKVTATLSQSTVRPTLTVEPAKPEPAVTKTATLTPTAVGLNYSLLPPPADWQTWPELPVLSEKAKDIYRTGVTQGTNPKAISIFGDCQSLPDAFWGRYDDPDYELTPEEQAYQTSINWFSGSFDRESVTVEKGTTAAAILWVGWLDGKEHDCLYGETPLACELRIHNPSIVVISLGTHWELRNEIYLRKIIDELLARNVLPVISTKADHREGEAWVNEQMVSIAHEYELPVWNFWTVVQPLENNGMVEGDPMYMNDAGLEMQRISALRMLDSLLSQLELEE
jgi:hypothetical protein